LKQQAYLLFYVKDASTSANATTALSLPRPTESPSSRVAFDGPSKRIENDNKEAATRSLSKRSRVATVEIDNNKRQKIWPKSSQNHLNSVGYGVWSVIDSGVFLSSLSTQELHPTAIATGTSKSSESELLKVPSVSSLNDRVLKDTLDRLTPTTENIKVIRWDEKNRRKDKVDLKNNHGIWQKELRRYEETTLANSSSLFAQGIAVQP